MKTANAVNSMNATDFRRALKTGLSGGYLFCGEEEYLKQYCIKEARRSVIPDAGLDVFNRVVITGERYTHELLAGALASLPVMCGKKLVELSGFDFSELSEEQLSGMCGILSQPEAFDSSVVILYVSPDELDIGTPKAPSKTFKALQAVLKPVIFDYETPARLIKWIQSHFHSNGVEADEPVCSLLIEYTGRDMTALAGEIEKLSAYALSGSGGSGTGRVTAEDVPKIVSRVKEIGAFDLANAVLDGDRDRVFDILRELKIRREKPELILAGISRVYSDLFLIKTLADCSMTAAGISSELKMNDYKAGLYMRAAGRRDAKSLRRALDLCGEADMKIKSTVLDSYLVIDRLAATVAMKQAF